MNFETNRNLISSVEHGFTDSIISKYSYTNDLLGRRTGKVQYFDNKVKNFDFGYNPRSEVTSATEQNNANFNYGFNYDNIGNRINSTESGISKSYETNSLNQYTANSVDTGFTPTYDADGNQTRIKTSAGIFTVEYNAENRPIQFKGSMGRIYNMSYDYMGRRFFMSSYFQGMHDGGSTELFYYNGYTLIESQQILLGPNAMRFTQSYIWDPTTKQATRPLAMFDNNNKTLNDANLSDARLCDVNFRDARFDVMFDNTQNIHYYTHDANKNVTELISDSGAISAHYEYSPFGATIASSGDLSYSNPFQFSSEFFDSELGLIYYNYRHYNALDGRWISRDPIEEKGGWNLYGMVKNNPIKFIDYLGRRLSSEGCEENGGEMKGQKSILGIKYGGTCCCGNQEMDPKGESGGCCEEGQIKPKKPYYRAKRSLDFLISIFGPGKVPGLEHVVYFTEENWKNYQQGEAYICVGKTSGWVIPIVAPGTFEEETKCRYVNLNDVYKNPERVMLCEAEAERMKPGQDAGIYIIFFPYLECGGNCGGY